MQFVPDSIRDKISRAINAEGMFFLAFIPYVAMMMYQTTMFPKNYLTLFKLLKMGCLAVFVLKILIFDSFTWKQGLMTGAMVFTGIMNWRASGQTILFMLFLTIIAAKDIEFKRILKVHIAICISIMAAALIAACAGYIDILKKDVLNANIRRIGWQYRYGLGIINTTDFAAHVFYITCSFLFLAKKWLSNKVLVLSIITALITFRLTFGKTDLLCSVLMVFLCFLDRVTEKHVIKHESKKNVYDNIFKYVGIIFFPLCMFVSFGLCLAYSEDSHIIVVLNLMFSDRLRLGNIDFQRREILPFGQYIDMIGFGNGNSTLGDEGYTFIDISYQNILLTMGVAALVLILMILVYICWIYHQNHILIIIMACIAISCMMDHHLAEIAYNPFMLLLYSACKSGCNDNFK